jgi:hypothetical protein
MELSSVKKLDLLGPGAARFRIPRILNLLGTELPANDDAQLLNFVLQMCRNLCLFILVYSFYYE